MARLRTHAILLVIVFGVAYFALPPVIAANSATAGQQIPYYRVTTISTPPNQSNPVVTYSSANPKLRQAIRSSEKSYIGGYGFAPLTPRVHLQRFPAFQHQVTILKWRGTYYKFEKTKISAIHAKLGRTYEVFTGLYYMGIAIAGLVTSIGLLGSTGVDERDTAFAPFSKRGFTDDSWQFVFMLSASMPIGVILVSIMAGALHYYHPPITFISISTHTIFI